MVNGNLIRRKFRHEIFICEGKSVCVLNDTWYFGCGKLKLNPGMCNFGLMSVMESDSWDT
jgi:hypothetical protein